MLSLKNENTWKESNEVSKNLEYGQHKKTKKKKKKQYKKMRKTSELENQQNSRIY